MVEKKVAKAVKKVDPNFLKVIQSDIPQKHRVVLVEAVQKCVDEIVSGHVKTDKGRSWKEAGRWDGDTLQALTDLVFERLGGHMHCVAGSDYSTSLRYAKKTLLILSTHGSALRLLIYKSVSNPLTKSSEEDTKSDLPEVDEAQIAKVKVVEALVDDDEAVRLARMTLARDPRPAHPGHHTSEEGPSTPSSSDKPADKDKGEKSIAQERAAWLRDALTKARGTHWHVVFDKHPLAATAMTADRRMVLGRGKYTYICFQHSAPVPPIFSAGDIDKNTLLYLAIFIGGVGMLWYHTVCGGAGGEAYAEAAEDDWACATAGKYSKVLGVALALLYTYSRLIAGVSKLSTQRAAAKKNA